MKKIVVVIPKKQIAEGAARGFQTKINGKTFYGLVVRKGGNYYAYRNQCRHLAITLDLNDEQFFNSEGTHLQCQMHGATYEIETGMCIAGPCVGAALASLEMEIEEETLVIQCEENPN